MDAEQEKELNIEILKYINEAEIISNRFRGLKDEICEVFRSELVVALKSRLMDKYSVGADSHISSAISKIWIEPIVDVKSKTFFGVESFSGKGHFNGNLFVGVFRGGANLDESAYSELGFNKLSEWWLNCEVIGEFENKIVNLQNSKLLTKIYEDDDFRKRLIDWTAKKIIDFIERNEKFVFQNII